MNRLILTLAGVATLAALGCTNGPADQLNGDNFDPGSLAADDNTYDHGMDPNQGDNGITDPNATHANDATIGSPEVIARLHSCSKVTYAGLGGILKSRGIDLTKTATNSTGALYKAGGSAFGIANYSGRVAEAVIGSTAAMSKEFDIFVAAALEIQTASKAGTLDMTGCPSVTLVDGSGNFTKDGLSCLMGKPATADHVAVANDAIVQATAKGLTKDQGQQIAIASLLEAAHTCE